MVSFLKERRLAMSEEKINEIVPTAPCDDGFIKSRILTVRGVQVMLDRDLAALYGVSTSRLNEQVKRNRERFPESFMFQLSQEEVRYWISQIATSNIDRSIKMGIRKLPYAFTEHGVIMLSSVLKSGVAVKASIRITNTFVAMRKAIVSIAPVMARLAETERLQLEEKTARLIDQQRNEERFDAIFKAMDGGEFPPQKVFFDGRHYEAYSFAKKLVGRAAKSILLVDGYCDDVTLDILASKRSGVKVAIATVAKTPITQTAIAKFNKQNPTLEIRHTGKFHDRFLIIDGKELYLFGASLKDLGRHYCAVSKMDAAFIPSILQHIS